MIAPPEAQGGGYDTAGLIARYREPLIRYFARRGRDTAAAEDLAHDTFLRLFALRGAGHVENAEAYLFQIARSVLNDYLRKIRVRRTHAAHVEEMFGDHAFALGPGRILEGKEALARLKAALDELKPRTRDVFLLARIEGFSYTQIAVRFGVSVRTVENDMAKAVAHLTIRLKSAP